MNQPKILIAGIGNIFMGDDAFGSEVARQLLRRGGLAGVTITDFGIRGIDLTYALTQQWDLVILIDACARGGAPGTLYLLEPQLEESFQPAQIDPHSLDPLAVLRAAQSMGANFNRIVLVACEPSPLPGDEDEFPTELSPPVRAAIPHAIEMIEPLVNDFANQASPAIAAGEA